MDEPTDPTVYSKTSKHDWNFKPLACQELPAKLGWSKPPQSGCYIQPFFNSQLSGLARLASWQQVLRQAANAFTPANRQQWRDSSPSCASWADDRNNQAMIIYVFFFFCRSLAMYNWLSWCVRCSLGCHGIQHNASDDVAITCYYSTQYTCLQILSQGSLYDSANQVHVMYIPSVMVS